MSWLPMSALAFLAGIVGFVSFFLSALVGRSGPIRLRHWVEEAGGGLKDLYDNPRRFEAFQLVLSLAGTLGLVLFYICLRLVLTETGSANAEVVAFLLFFLVFLSAEMLSRGVLRGDREAALRGSTGLFRTCLLLVTPIVRILAAMIPRAGSTNGEDGDDDEASDEEIEAYLDVGEQEGILEEGEGDLIQRVIDFGDSLVRSVMTPRIDVVSAPVESDPGELADIFLSSGHSRIPLYRESVDDIVGVLHIRSLFAALRGDETVDPRALLTAALFVPETKPLNELLRELQSQHQQMAIVVDEYGGTAGLVTVEDLLEEIVGEIVDEHEEDASPTNEEVSTGIWRIDGRSALAVIEEIFDIDLGTEQPYETVGGLIFGALGYVPAPGEVVEMSGLRFTVDSLVERRIESVRVEIVESYGGTDRD